MFDCEIRIDQLVGLATLREPHRASQRYILPPARFAICPQITTQLTRPPSAWAYGPEGSGTAVFAPTLLLS
jgi:hypothetical protein